MAIYKYQIESSYAQIIDENRNEELIDENDGNRS